jgi:AcrR family transcriptional regulator
MTKQRVARSKRSQPRRLVGRPPNQVGEQTRQRILSAARERFSRVGFERATNQEIAAQADVTAAALYRYFDSKVELWAAVVLVATAELAPRLQRIIEAETSVRAVLRALLNLFSSSSEGESSAARFLSSIPDEMQRHPELKRRILREPGEIFALVGRVVEMGISSGEVAPAHAQRVVSLTIAVLMGMSAYTKTLGPEYGKHAAQGFIDLLEGRLFDTKAPAR